MTFMAGAPHTTRQFKHDMDFTAALLQATLAARRVSAVVSSLFDGPQIETYEIALGLGVEPEKIERLAGAMAMAAGASNCRVARVGGRLLVEVPKPKTERKVLRAGRLKEVKPHTSFHVPLGLGTTGLVVWFDLADERMCHVVLGGTTRSGKTNALHWLLRCLLTQNPMGRLRLILADPKRRELEPFRLSRHLLHPVAHDLTEIVTLLLWLQDQMVQRAERGCSQPRILMIIDEVRQLVRRDRRVQGLLSSIAEMGAGVGIHLIVATQQPGAKALGEALPNFPARLLGRVASATLTFGAAGRAKSQAENLLGRGDMLLIAEGGMMNRLQVPLVSAAELADVPCWESADQVPRLDLPQAIDWATPPGTDTRGGWNRKELDLEAVRRLVELDAFTASDLQRVFGINYDRAQRLVEQYAEEDEEAVVTTRAGRMWTHGQEE
jgi:DNA segregation ATPase FtsK/SpoIIIE-like protein